VAEGGGGAGGSAEGFAQRGHGCFADRGLGGLVDEGKRGMAVLLEEGFGGLLDAVEFFGLGADGLADGAGFLAGSCFTGLDECVGEPDGFFEFVLSRPRPCWRFFR